MSDLLLQHALVLTMDQKDTMFEDGFVLIRGGKIEAVGPSSQMPEHTGGLQAMDCRAKIVMPGFINTHSHLPMIVFRTLGDDIPDRLNRYLFPLESRTMNREMAVAGANYAFMELLRGGVTTVFDSYYFENDIAMAAEAAGIRAVLSETVMCRPAPDSQEPYGGIAHTLELIANWKAHPRIRPAVNCHAPYTNDAAHLRECHRIARENGLVMSMHVSEMDYEQEEWRTKYGITPFAWLDSLGILDEHFLAAHAIHANDADIELLAKRGVKISHNAGSNSKSAKGIAPVRSMQQKGVVVSLGSDGAMSGNTLDIITQLPQVAKLQKLSLQDRAAYPACEVMRMATINGAKALGLADVTGSLEPGKQADVIIFETDSVNMQPIYDPYSTIVYGANPSNVETTIVDGKILMHKGEFLTLDFARIKQEMLSYQKEIRGILPELDRNL